MGANIADSLQELNAVKLAIRDSLVRKGVDISSTPFAGYAAKFDGIGDAKESTMGIIAIRFYASGGINTLHLYTGQDMFDCTINWGDDTYTECPPDGGYINHFYALAGTYIL